MNLHSLQLQADAAEREMRERQALAARLQLEISALAEKQNRLLNRIACVVGTKASETECEVLP